MNDHAYDLFNGDADGICALHQLRMAEPREATLVTGVKRDIELLRHLPAGEAADATVLDLCFDRNETGVRRVLDAGGRVHYIDHHAAHNLFEHPRLTSLIDTSKGVCSALLVDQHVGGRFRDWAIVGAFGDNLLGVAGALAQQRGHDEPATACLGRLGLLLNYNAYGETAEDLHLHPRVLYEALHEFESPFDFIDHAPEYGHLAEGYELDRRGLASLRPYRQDDTGELYLLPGEPWARRLAGTLANQRAALYARKSIAVLTSRTDGGYLASVRVAANCTAGADVLCRRYPGGNGRSAAAGVDQLPDSALDGFIADFFLHIKGDHK
ncbi:hypothetical protein [Roseateles saccharophilus]|uniref:Acetyltransferase n=1 Tax=Roseateles saccharophilus TaxID=304 RepID=A0A4R3ULE9_ROSSA|nr:hypothetical protein [Roseateles saccharophilus]MDG0833491.1 hypothetical protein [Roseateles saccharophilus]TCU92516.1 hypothetical protein EV671_102229 [Roseateles saccharophilus]